MEPGRRFADKAVMVFGGNSGIGQTAAVGFAAEGARVCITGRDRTTLDATLATLPGGMAMVADIADPAASQRAAAAVAEAFGRIDIAFINAGIGGFTALDDLDPVFWDKIHTTNLRGCVFAAQAVLRHMPSGGAIVFNGSVGSVSALPGSIAYSSAKAGLRAAARIIAGEKVHHGIRVNVVSPGPTETPIIRRNLGQVEGEEATLRAGMIAAVPMHRMGHPDEIARAVLFWRLTKRALSPVLICSWTGDWWNSDVAALQHAGGARAPVRFGW